MNNKRETKGQRDQGTKGPKDQGTKIPKDQRGDSVSFLVSWSLSPLVPWSLSLLVSWSLLAQTNILYQNNFEKTEIGKLPEDFLVIEGAFTVKEENGNKFMELPGSPLDSFAVQFGPPATGDISVSARIRGTAKGRRFPAFGVGLNGVSGYRLQVSPAKQSVELYKDQQIRTNASFEWKSGEWTRLRLQVRQLKEGGCTIQGKAWPEGAAEPEQWTILLQEPQTPTEGRASVFASPFSGTPVQFDDLMVTALLDTNSLPSK